MGNTVSKKALLSALMLKILHPLLLLIDHAALESVPSVSCLLSLISK